MSISEQNDNNQDTKSSNNSDTTVTTSTTSKEKDKSETKSIQKIKGNVGQYYVESIIFDNKPCFLTVDTKTGKIIMQENIMHNNQIIRPLNVDQFGYIPYSFTNDELNLFISKEISKQEILDDIKAQIDTYVVLEEKGKHLILVDVVLTYCLEWISTIHYPFFIGDTESGKSSALHIAKWLCYRCHLGDDIPAADVYNFLGTDEEGCGTIAEDEAQELWKDREKIRMYKSGYTKGHKKARILGTHGTNKHQVYYNTFCPKWFGGEYVPKDKGFIERLVQIHMISGTPRSNIKRVGEVEKAALSHLRNKILIWKLQNMTKGLPRYNSGLERRDQELWEDFLSVADGTTYFEMTKEVVKFYTEQRHQKISDSIEARIFRIISRLRDDNFEILAQDLWNTIIRGTEELPGEIDVKQSKSFHPDDFGFTISMNKLADMMEEKFHAKKIVRVENHHRRTYYAFEREKVKILATKYNVEINSD